MRHLECEIWMTARSCLCNTNSVSWTVGFCWERFGEMPLGKRELVVLSFGGHLQVMMQDEAADTGV